MQHPVPKKCPRCGELVTRRWVVNKGQTENRPVNPDGSFHVCKEDAAA